MERKLTTAYKMIGWTKKQHNNLQITEQNFVYSLFKDIYTYLCKILWYQYSMTTYVSELFK